MKDKYKKLCNSLNLDKTTADEAWHVFSTVSEQIIIEGCKLHWLACAIYTCAANNSTTSTAQTTQPIQAAAASTPTTTPTTTTNSSNTTSTANSNATSQATPTTNINNSTDKDGSRTAGVTTPGSSKRPHRNRDKDVQQQQQQLQSQAPVVDNNTALPESTGVPLSRLLRLSELSLVEFFSKMKKWLDITNQGKEMRAKIDRLERNFNVSAVVFKKFKEIFADVFKPINTKPKDEKSNYKSPERERTRKSTANARLNAEVTTSDVYKFCWILYVNFKGTRSSIRDDLVNSYYRLLACIDFCYANALVSKFAHEFLNPNFKGLPNNFSSPDFKLLDPSKHSMCILPFLCSNWDGDVVEAKEIREHWLKPYIDSLVRRKVLQMSSEQPHLGCFESSYFESNMTKLTKEQDIVMLSSGDFDERIFLSDNAEKELGTPTYAPSDLKKMINERDSSSNPSSNDNDLDKQRPSLRNGGRFVPQTPLSNRNYLANKTVHPSSPVANATQKVGDLNQMLSESTGVPTSSLEDIFRLCTNNPRESIMDRVKKMTDKFVIAFVDGSDSLSITITKARADLARKLYFKVLESIVVREQKRLPTDKIGDSLSSLLFHEILHISLFACCVEIVLASHNATGKTFPWILDVYKDFGETRLYPFLFYKVIELVIREEDRLSRDIVKHLAFIEERVLESMAWESDSPLWTAIAAHGSIPSCQDVVLPPSTNEHNLFEMSPLSSLRRNEGLQSPMPVSGRYSINTMEGGARRRLFDQSSVESSPANQSIIHVAVPQRAENGEIRYVIEACLVNNANSIESDSSSNRHDIEQTAHIRSTVKANPVTLFFRKVYYLAQLRFRDLWNRLQINTPDLQRRIWTLFETQIRNHTNLLRDRHLDQMIMCATYAIIKVCRTDRSPRFFQEIMKVYRFQPQANIEVYRSVLLSKPPLKLLDDGPSRTVPNSPITRSPSKRIASSPMRNGATRASIPPPPDAPQHKERGDLIEFYNNVYVNEVRSMMIRFARPDSALNLSPLPRMNTNPISPWRRVSQQHSVYVSPLKSSSLPPSPGRQLSYSFQRSPSKDLRTINNMINKQRAACKRILQDDDGENTKKPCISDVASRKINDIMNERRSSNY